MKNQIIIISIIISFSSFIFALISITIQIADINMIIQFFIITIVIFLLIALGLYSEWLKSNQTFYAFHKIKKYFFKLHSKNYNDALIEAAGALGWKSNLETEIFTDSGEKFCSITFAVFARSYIFVKSGYIQDNIEFLDKITEILRHIQWDVLTKKNVVYNIRKDKNKTKYKLVNKSEKYHFMLKSQNYEKAKIEAIEAFGFKIIKGRKLGQDYTLLYDYGGKYSGGGSIEDYLRLLKWEIEQMN